MKNQLYMFCSDPDCVCKNKCCQDCEQNQSCDKACENFKYKQKIYSDNEFLASELNKLADEKDDWLIGVAADIVSQIGRARFEYFKEAQNEKL